MREPAEQNTSSGEYQAVSWRLADFAVAGVWVSLPVAAVVGRHYLIGLFEDFDFELPPLSDALLHLNAAVALVVTAFLVLLLLFMLPVGSIGRRRFRIVAGLTGVIAAVIWSGALVVPLLRLWKELG